MELDTKADDKGSGAPDPDRVHWRTNSTYHDFQLIHGVVYSGREHLSDMCSNRSIIWSNFLSDKKIANILSLRSQRAVS